MEDNIDFANDDDSIDLDEGEDGDSSVDNRLFLNGEGLDQTEVDTTRINIAASNENSRIRRRTRQSNKSNLIKLKKQNY